MQVVGSSGAVLGFVGLTVADLVVNHENLFHALMRLVIIVASATFFIVTAVTKVSRRSTANCGAVRSLALGAYFPSCTNTTKFLCCNWEFVQQIRLGNPSVVGLWVEAMTRGLNLKQKGFCDWAQSGICSCSRRPHLCR